MTTTWMCDNGHHGSATRRGTLPGFEFSEMYTGECAGTVYNVRTREIRNCECECHKD